MVYARRYRRKSVRRNRTLSTRRIFNNKGAKAQAKQIYALRRAVNKVRRSCAPEVKTYDTPVNIQNFTATTEEITGLSNTNLRITMPNISQGTADWNRIGDKIRLLPLTWFVNGLFRKITHSTNGVPLYNLLTSNGCGMRIVAVQAKTTSDELPDYEDIFTTAFEESPNTTLTMVNLNCPFKTGITTKYHILYNKVFYFSENSPVKNLKIKIVPKIKNQRWETGIEYPAGNIILFALFGGLQTTGSNLNENDYSQVELTHWLKIAFTDT